MLPVESPFKTYTGLDGKPLNNGYVYFGLPNENPITSPIIVYWDVEGTIPAAQPLRTVNGYIMRSGTPANVFVDGAYSELVQNAKKIQVFYAKTSDEFSIASLITQTVGDLGTSGGSAKIGYLPSGSGAVPTDVQSKLRETISILDFVPKSERAAVIAGTSTMDLTAAIQQAINEAGSTKRLRWIGVVNTGLITSTASVDWVFDSGASIKQIPAAYASGATHVILSGPRIRIENGSFDGNQSAMVAGQGSNGILISGFSPTVLYTRVRNYNGRGYDCNSVNIGVKRGLHIGCNFEDNAGLGRMTTGAAYLDFTNCTEDRNGYGFQKTRANYADTSHGFVAFGSAARMRSHHITFTGCMARDNGRDGFNVNQGSYAIKFIGCLAHGNDDGGFTIASDNTGTGLPGEGEACYDIEFIDCEAYNNYGSGLAAYQPVHNLKVIGGRYYNNHRLAGNQAAASSYYNGIYIANGSTGYNIDACCYDDRQFCMVSSAASGVVAAIGWVAGTMNYYPKVAVYRGTDGAFRGYGKITAESSGSVTITPTSVDGVSLASIVAGDYITQAVQHNGVFLDNNTQGLVACDGAGHRTGAQGTTGFLVYSGGFTFGQNVILPKERLSASELLVNPSFETDTTGWTYSLPGGGTQTFYTGPNRRSAGALQLTAGTGQADADGSVVTGGLQAMLGQFIEMGVWVYAPLRADATVTLYWLVGATAFTSSVVHPGGGWRYLRIGAQIPGNVTAAFPRYSVPAGRTAWFDAGKFRAVDFSMDPRETGIASRNLPL